MKDLSKDVQTVHNDIDVRFWATGIANDIEADNKGNRGT